MPSETEVLEQLVALSFSDFLADVSLRCLYGIHTLEVLSPRVTVDGVIGLPYLSILILEGITSAINPIQIAIPFCAFY